MKPLNNSVVTTPPSGIRKFFDIAQQMQDVISLGVGEPDFVTPWHIREAAIHSIENGSTTYTGSAGLLELREAICAQLFGRYAAQYSPIDETIVTVGVSEGLDLALRTLLNPGDEVLIMEPCYVSYVPGIRFAGGVPVSIPTRGSEGFQVRPEEVEAAITPRTKAILLCYPSNPTGTTQTRATMQVLVDIAVRHDLYIISDEIYDRLNYLQDHVCVPTLQGARERTILLNGFSKSYAMTGWRVGYLCAPRPIAEAILKVHQYTLLCASHISQIAALEAAKNGERAVLEMVEEYNQRRRYFVKGLNEIGLSCSEPSGAFYAFPSIAATGLTSEQFAERLLQEERVAVIPGSAFGASGEGYIRCSYASSIRQLEQALERMGRFMLRCTGDSNGMSTAKVFEGVSC